MVLKKISNNYYVSSFFWSTLQKVLTALLGFFSVPILLNFYGIAEYGILSLATACNGYMHLLDLGMNVGAVKFFSQWRAEGKQHLIFKVARTNITFYIIIASINILGLLIVAQWGESWFSITHDQFLQFRSCLYIIAVFSLFSWVTTAFNQLLIANKQIDYTMQIQCVQIVLKALLIVAALKLNLSLSTYFFFFTAILAILIIPYSYRCLKEGLIDSLSPAKYWGDFKVVLTFSLSIFALSLFQATATQSRPIILSMFANNGADAVAQFKIIEVIPQLIIMIGGTFSGIFLPKTAEMVAKKDQIAIKNFAYKWTRYTSVVIACLTFPFILCASQALSAYVGEQYAHLSPWLIIWCVTVLVQMHTTPGNALVLAYGKTKLLVIVTAVDCLVSICLNILLCRYFEVGSAIIAYFIYVLIIIGLYYLVFYKTLLHLSRWRLFKGFLIPVLIGAALLPMAYFIPISRDSFNGFDPRVAYILVCLIKSIAWLVPYLAIMLIFKIVDIRQLTKKEL